MPSWRGPGGENAKLVTQRRDTSAFFPAWWLLVFVKKHIGSNCLGALLRFGLESFEWEPGGVPFSP